MEKSYWWGILVIVVALFLGVIFYSPPVGQVIVEVGEPISVTPTYMDISSIDTQALIASNPDLIIIDVSPNYAQGHIPNAINYYVGDGSLNEAIPTLDPNAKYLVYCHFASASRAGAQRLVDAGFTNVYRLEDDYGGWVTRGYPLEY